MRVLYDGYIYAAQAAGGINRYFENLIERLPSEIEPILMATASSAVNFPRRDNLKLRLSHSGLRWRRPLRGIGRWLRRRRFADIEDETRADLLHPTYYRLLSGRPMPRSRWPVVVTVYDMIHERFARTLDPSGRQAAMKAQCVEDAEHVICISENTRRDLLAYHSIEPSKVSVIPLATEMGQIRPGPPELAPAAPYFLYVGGRHGYKNFDRLLQAFAVVIAKHPETLLCVVGAPFRAREQRRLVELRVQDNVRHFGVAADETLARLYRSSIGLVYPSLYEGFGIPPLEAMCCETAVIAGNTSSIPEVVGDAGLLIDPTSSEQLAQAMFDLVERPSLRTSLIERGHSQAARFHWQRTAQETVRVYRSVIERHAA